MPTPSLPASAPVLVTGATGRQGGATARALLAAGTPVRPLVRDPESARAEMNDRPFDGEVAQAVNLIEGHHAEAGGWSEGRWSFMGPYFAAKPGVRDRVRAAGFAHWTLISRASSWRTSSRRWPT